MGTILAIDPGNIQSGYVIVEHDGEEIRRVLEVGKIENNVLLSLIALALAGYIGLTLIFVEAIRTQPPTP